MIEIKSRYGGKVLYTAESATDVRQALVEAVKGGAYLVGAYLGGAMWRQVAVALAAAVEAMNDSGRHWIKGSFEKALDDGTKAYCSVGSVNANSDGTMRSLALWLLASVTAGPVENFNDHEGTSWEDVQAVFRVAVRNAERFAGAELTS